MQKSAYLYVFEGPNNVGKSVLSHELVKFLGSRGCQAWHAAFPGNKVGTIGRLVHELHHAPPKHRISSIDPISLQVLHVAAHIDAIRRSIIPRLQQGVNVVLDRFWWSTLIYGLQSGVERKSLEPMLHLEKIHWQGIQPDLLFLIDRPVPFGQKPQAWDDLREAYHQYAMEEAHPHPVKIIRNDSTLEEAVDRVVQAVGL